MSNYASIIQKTFDLKLGSIYISPTYWQAGLIVLLLFLLVFSLARLRYLYVNWSLGKSSLSMLFWGFLLALILEGFLILSGRTLLTEIIGWNNAPKPISVALDAGREKLVDVLGENDEVPTSVAKEEESFEEFKLKFQSLSPSEMEEIKYLICE